MTKPRSNRPYHETRFVREDRPLVYAHRGASAYAPENTIRAVETARAQGADGIECDVMLCKTGEVVVCHDERLDRLCGVPLVVSELPLAALRELRVLEKRFPGTSASIPTLAELVESGGPDSVWNVELKAVRTKDAEDVACAVGKELSKLPLEGRVLVSSFHPHALLTIRRFAPLLPTAFLWDGPPRAIPALLWRMTATHAVHPEGNVVDAGLVRAWHALGRIVNVWTVDAADEIRRLAAAGVDGIVTNCPDVALSSLAAMPPSAGV